MERERERVRERERESQRESVSHRDKTRETERKRRKKPTLGQLPHDRARQDLLHESILLEDNRLPCARLSHRLKHLPPRVGKIVPRFKLVRHGFHKGD